MRRNLDRLKTDKYIAKAKSCQEVRDIFLKQDVMSKHGLSYDGDAKFYVTTIVETNFAFTIYASKFTIDTVKTIKPSERNYLMDGTFDCIPSYFYQLLIILIEIDNDVS